MEMKDVKEQEIAKSVPLEELVALVEKAARTIERLQADLSARDALISQLEQSVAATGHAAERFSRMKAQLESLPAATGGFTAHGQTYATFEEAFDAAYPPQQAATEESPA
jgi:hypothetical protein